MEETEPGNGNIVELQKALMMAPALGLPDLTKPFELFVHKRQYRAPGVLAQRLGSWKQPVGYFSKQLDNMSKGWPGSLCTVAATVLLIQEARDLTMGQKMVEYVANMVVTLLQRKGGSLVIPQENAEISGCLAGTRRCGTKNYNYCKSSNVSVDGKSDRKSRT